MKIDQQTFEVEINRIMQYALNKNLIDGMSCNQLISLFIDPEKHIRARLFTSKEPIEIRKQERLIKILFASKEYCEFINMISNLKKDNTCMNLLNAIEIRRIEGVVTVFVSTQLLNN